MIGFLRGILAVKQPPILVLDVHGVGYELAAPMSTFYELPTLGEELTLLTHLLVREDAQILYGFISEEERVLFRNLLRVSGIGANSGSDISLSAFNKSAALNSHNQLTPTTTANTITSMTR